MHSKEIIWNQEKDRELRQDRDISFNDVLDAMAKERILDIILHPNQETYPGQKIMVIEHEHYAYLVPFVEAKEYIFLKTIIPSRKATKIYVKR